VQIVLTDRLPEPHPEDVPPLSEALREAADHRPEIEQAELNLRNQEATIKSTEFWYTVKSCIKAWRRPPLGRSCDKVGPS